MRRIVDSLKLVYRFALNGPFDEIRIVNNYSGFWGDSPSSTRGAFGGRSLSNPLTDQKVIVIGAALSCESILVQWERLPRCIKCITRIFYK